MKVLRRVNIKLLNTDFPFFHSIMFIYFYRNIGRCSAASLVFESSHFIRFHTLMNSLHRTSIAGITFIDLAVQYGIMGISTHPYYYPCLLSCSHLLASQRFVDALTHASLHTLVLRLRTYSHTSTCIRLLLLLYSFRVISFRLVVFWSSTRQDVLSTICQFRKSFHDQHGNYAAQEYIARNNIIGKERRMYPRNWIPSDII